MDAKRSKPRKVARNRSIPGPQLLVDNHEISKSSPTNSTPEMSTQPSIEMVDVHIGSRDFRAVLRSLHVGGSLTGCRPQAHTSGVQQESAESLVRHSIVPKMLVRCLQGLMSILGSAPRQPAGLQSGHLALPVGDDPTPVAAARKQPGIRDDIYIRLSP